MKPIGRRQNESHGNRRSRRAGMILIVVTIVLVMLSLAGFGFVAMMYTENKAAHLHGDEMHLQNAVASGAEWLKATLAASPQPGTDVEAEAGGMNDNPQRFQNVLLFQESGTEAAVRFTILSPRVENGQPVGVRYGVENESARLNLAMLVQWDKQVAGSGQKALLQLPEMTEAIADAILDWLDSDAAQRQLGAESDYYAGLNSPYQPRNGDLESLDELLLVKDVSRTLLYGADLNRNFEIEPDELKVAAGGLGATPESSGLPWSSYLTLYSAERNARSDGLPRINLNSPDLRRLHQSLTGLLKDPWVRFLIAYRQYGPYRGDKTPRAGEAVPLDLNKPAKYKIASILDLVGARVAVPQSSGAPRIYEGPFGDSADSMRNYLPSLLDVTTLVAHSIQRGRINVNLAPREVLAAVPGMEDTLVERIIAGRGLQADQSDLNRRFPTWLLTEGLVERKTMRALLPYLTGGGDVYRAQIVGFFDKGSPSARAEVVIDATGEFPRQIYWRDLRQLGRGFSLEVLQGSSPENDLAISSARLGNVD